MRFLRYVSEVVCDLGGREAPETVFVAHANLNVVGAHLSFETLLEGEDGGVDSVVYFQVLIVSEGTHGTAWVLCSDVTSFILIIGKSLLLHYKLCS